MANRPTLTDVAGSGNLNPPTYNANNQELELSYDNLLGRGGTGENNNSLTGDLDADSNTIINLPDPTLANHPATKGYVDSVTGVGTNDNSQVKVSSADATAAFLEGKVLGTTGEIVATKTGSGTETLVLSLESSAAKGQLIDTQIFTTGGTWTKPTDTTQVEVWVIGGGGGSGGSQITGVGDASVGAGGGGGGGSYKHITSGLGATENVVRGGGGTSSAGANGGAGDTSSFGSHCQATGGAGGLKGAVITAGGVSSNDSGGGVGSGGDINLKGSAGRGGTLLTIVPMLAVVGAGGGAPFGFNARILTQEFRFTASITGVSGTNPGQGSSGAINVDTGVAKNGASGVNGIVIVKSYR